MLAPVLADWLELGLLEELEELLWLELELLEELLVEGIL